GTILNDDSAPLMIDPDDWPDSGLTLFLDGPDLRIVETGTLVDVRPAEDFSRITTVIVTGRDGFADTLTLDFIGGAPIPIDGLTFDGGAGHGIDTLVLENGAATTIAHEFIDASSGTIQIDGLTVNYLGLEPIEDNLDAIDRRFTYGSADDMILLSDDGGPDNGLSQLTASGTAETVVFLNPGRFLTIDAGAGRDRVVVQSLDSQFVADIRINGNEGHDTLVGGTLGETLDGGSGDDRILGLGGNDSLLGGDGNDYLRGYGGDDTLDGGPGDDLALGTDGDDLLIGGDGADTLDGQVGNDSLFGAGGDDSLLGRSGNDYLDGQGSSRDTLWGGEGDDTLRGGAGIADQLVERGNADFTLNDTLLTGFGSDVVVEFERAYLKGGAGDNRLDASGFSGRVTLVGAAGNDTLIGGLGRDRLIGNAGDDMAFGGAGRDTLYGSSGDDTLYGQGSNDILRGGPGSDSLLGGVGVDNLGGGSGADTLDGQDGADLLVESAATSPTRMYQLTDTSLSDLASPAVVDKLVSIERARLYGSNDDDVFDASAFSGSTWLFGFGGNDTLVGGAGNDFIDAGAGDDGLSGRGGDDTLLGGTGNDTLLGGPGDDGLRPGVGTDTALGESGDDVIDADDGEADVVAKSGNGTGTSPDDALSVDALDQVDEAFTNPGGWTWADGWP
ncbi:MAG TPA: calcium-binding protein, partial [Planctomycetaceae bacterium]|nr:calcium-binding protein [Planctomycetaceae bacterium]